MKRTGILIAALTGMLMAAHAQAQGSGVYLGIGGSANWSHGGTVYNNTVNDDVATGGKVYGGYKWDRFSMEVGFTHLGKYETHFLGQQIAEMETRGITVAGLYSWPFMPGYSLGAKLGLVFTEADYTCISLCGVGSPLNVDTKKRGLAGVLGLNAFMHVTSNLLVRIEFEHYGNVKHQIDLTEYNEAYDVFTVGLQLNF